MGVFLEIHAYESSKEEEETLDIKYIFNFRAMNVA